MAHDGKGCFLANADGSIVLATYATISSEVDSLDNGSWIVVTYSLAMCAIQPTVSRPVDNRPLDLGADGEYCASMVN